MWSILLPLSLAAALPPAASAAVSAILTWNPSSDASVTGYNLYYGPGCHQYTNMVPVGAVTNAIVPGLTDGTVYFFAAKAHNANGVESPFSNEAVFCGFTIIPGTLVQQAVIPTNNTGDQLTFSLGSDAPAGASVNPTNGLFTWAPGTEFASTTNVITVTISDQTNPNASSSETLLIVVTDYLKVTLGNSAVQTGQNGSLSISLSASDTPTNIAVAVAWPADQFGPPTLTFAPPVIDGSVEIQGSTAVVQLQLDPAQPITQGAPLAQINFQALPGQPSAFIPVAITGVSGVKSDASSYLNTSAHSGQVAVVADSPLLQPQSTVRGRALALYGNPGANYQVQYTTNLAPPIVWVPLLNHQQGDLTESVDVDSSQPTVYYRLQQL